MASNAKDLHDFEKDIHAAILELKEDVRRDLKEELTKLKQELNGNLAKFDSTLQERSHAINEAEDRISEMEGCNVVTKDSLLNLLKERQRLQDKVTDLERSRHCQILKYRVLEDTKGNSVVMFVEGFLTKEISLTEDMPSSQQVI